MTEPRSDNQAGKGGVSARIARILSIARWVSLAFLAALMGYHFASPETSPFARYRLFVDVQADDGAEDRMAEIARRAPDARQFSHATSVALVDMGHQLLDEPQQRVRVAKKLHELSNSPDSFADDMTAYLALRMAYWQLRHDPKLTGSGEAALLMWQAAEQIDRVGRYQTVESRIGRRTQ